MSLMDLGDGDLRVVRAVLDLPLASAGDIAAVQDRTVSGVHARLRGLSAEGLGESRLVKSVHLCCARGPVDRYFLTEYGQAEFGLSGVTWHQPGTLARLLERLTSVEWLYPAAAALPGLGGFQAFRWVDNVAFDAAVRYERGWAALFWAGLLRSEQVFKERLEQFGDDLLTLQAGGGPPRPGLICVVASDRWQVELALRVARGYGMEDWVRVWCVSDDSWHGAEVPLTSRGWVHQPVYLRKMGRCAWDKRVRKSLWAVAGGQDAARVLQAAAEWPGMPTRLARVVLAECPSGRRAQNSCRRLMQLGLLDRWQERGAYRYRLSPQGMELLAGLDRASEVGAWRRIRMARWEKPDGFEVHEYGLLEVAQEFAAAGLVVVAGWRDWENLGSGGGIAPDLLVYLRYGPYGPGWHYLEYERSARSPSAAARKLGGYDSPLRGNDWPVLVVCRTDRAELNFQQSGMGMGIRMMTTTIPRFRRHGAVGNLACWSRYGEPVAIG